MSKELARANRVITPSRGWSKFQPLCSQCNDSGAVLATVIDEPGGAPFVFSCSCDAAYAKARVYPRWSNADKKKYRREGEVL